MALVVQALDVQARLGVSSTGYVSMHLSVTDAPLPAPAGYANANRASTDLHVSVTGEAEPEQGMKKNYSVSAMWDWGAGRPSYESSVPPSPSVSCSGSMWNWRTSRPASTPGSAPVSNNNSTSGGVYFAPGMPSRSRLSRGPSVGGSLWNWGGQQPPPSREASTHGGSAYKGASLPMTRNNSMVWNWASPSHDSAAASRDNSLHGGNKNVSFNGSGGGGMSRNSSVGAVMWSWANGRVSPPSTAPGSAENSAHGGGAYSQGMSRASYAAKMWDWKAGSPPVTQPGSTDSPVHGGSANRSIPPIPREDSISYALWSWANGRHSPPDSNAGSMTGSVADSRPGSRGNSLRGGSEYERRRFLGGGGAAEGGGGVEGGADGGVRFAPSTKFVSEPKPETNYASSHGGMARNSSFTALWNWGQGRPSPPQSRENSLHGGSHFEKYNRPIPTSPGPRIDVRVTVSPTDACAMDTSSHPTSPGDKSTHGGSQFEKYRRAPGSPDSAAKKTPAGPPAGTPAGTPTGTPAGTPAGGTPAPPSILKSPAQPPAGLKQTSK